jgi:anti-sigma factor RsiW
MDSHDHAREPSNGRDHHVHHVLGAYVDDELPADQAAAIAGHLTVCADCSAAYESTLATVATLREGLVHYSAPDTLRVRVRAALRDAARADATLPAAAPPAPRRRPWASRWAAAAALVLLSSGTTLVATRAISGARRNDAIVEREVLASHIRSLMPAHLTDVQSNDQHNVKPWFDGRLDFSPTVPRLDDQGFPLLGGRLDYVAGRPVAVVVYGRRQHAINVFSWPTSAGDVGASTAASRGYNAVHWRAGGVEQWVVSDLNATELAGFAKLLRGAR